MRGLAELAMRSPKHSVFLAMIFASIPMLFWLSAAIVSLVILRRGISQGLVVLMWALLPGIAWAAMGQFTVVTGLIVTVGLASVLRQTLSWQKTLLALLPMGGLLALILAQLVPQQISELSETVMLFIAELNKQSGQTTVDLGESLKPLVTYGVMGIITWFNLVSCLMGLVLARFWQAQLYNPGGFREEFHGIRLSLTISMLLLALTLAGSMLSPVMVVLVPVASLPLFIAGLALVHGLVGIRKLGSIWLVAMYTMLMLVAQLAYPVIILTACLDSLFDFRTRVANKAHQG